MKKIKLGIFGLNRGHDNYEAMKYCGFEIVALCDKNPKYVEEAKAKLDNDVAVYDNFDEFIEHGFDALYLANYFFDHASYAVKALEKNIHVISECISSGTMAESVRLVRAAEKSDAIYMLGENYPYMKCTTEMRKVYQDGSLGKLLFAEGEYNHPVADDDVSFITRYYENRKHWRNYCPVTYYITHSLGPLMMATHSNPVRVTAMPIFHPKSESASSAKYVGDNTAIITCLNDDDSVYRVTGCAAFGAHENSYRLACEKGQIENVRGTDNKILLRYNSWNVPEGMEEDNCYITDFDPKYTEIGKKSGHCGGDFFMFKEFFDCITNGTKPYMDEYVATTMASVAILGHRSLLEYGVPYDIPDFHKEEDRKKYENDTLTPFWGTDGSAPTLPCCSRPDYKPSEDMLKRFDDIVNKG